MVEREPGISSKRRRRGEVREAALIDQFELEKKRETTFRSKPRVDRSWRKHLPFGDLCQCSRYVDSLRQHATLPIASHARHLE